MKVRINAPLAALMLLTLSACGGIGGSAGNGTTMMPSMNARSLANLGNPDNKVEPLTKHVTVKAVLGRKPLDAVLVTLFKSSPPDCPLCEPKRNQKIAEGVTSSNGEVVLTGAWTKKTYLCAVAFASHTKHHKLVQLCAKPIPKILTLQFN